MHESCYVCGRHLPSGTKCHWPATDVRCVFIIVLLTLNWNYSVVFVLCFTVVIYGRHTNAFNNANRCVFSLSWRFSVSAMYADFGIQNFEAVIRKSLIGFVQRFAKTTNSLIINSAVESSWNVRIDIWSF